MNNEPESFEYDDSEAVAYIRKKLSPALKERLSDDDIVYFVDLIYEYYESRGIIEEFEDESDDAEGPNRFFYRRGSTIDCRGRNGFLRL